MVKYRGKYILEGLDEIPPEMLADLDIAYDVCKRLHDSFPCEMCGKCCHQPYIMLLDGEPERIAKHLMMSADEFIEKYLHRVDGRWLFKKSGKCKFLDDGKRCAIWTERPEVCRDFPYLVAKFMSRVYLSIVNDIEIDLSYMEDDWPCTPIIKNSVHAMITDARKKRLTRSV